MNSEIKICQNCKKDFAIEPEDFVFYDKIKVPPPTWCPECRFRRRMVWRNEKIFFKRKCDATGKDILSMFHQSAPVKVYDRDYWWSDAWDPMEYGKDYDFSRPFFEQLKELINTVPWPSRSFLKNVNSEYCMNCSNLKNCNFLFDADYVEDSSYGVAIEHSKNCFDNFLVDSCELCCGCFFCTRCYKTFYSSNCEDCRDVSLSRDCINCSDCFGCVGLRNKSYCIFNKQYSKDGYFKEIAKFNAGSYKDLSEKAGVAQDVYTRSPVKYMHGSRNAGVSGDYIYNSKNVLDSYMTRSSEDCKYCHTIKITPGGKQCYDYDLFGWNAERIYECNVVGYNASNVKFSVLVYIDSRNVEYSLSCITSVSDLFGCVGLQKKQYCILNKQYSKEDYEKLIPKIKAHMNSMPYVDSKGKEYRYGEFLPAELSPFAYNDSLAQEYAPLKEQDAANQGFLWREVDDKSYTATLSWKDLPDNVDETDDSILGETILCEEWDSDSVKAKEHNCTKAFRITKAELDFYRKMKLPLPRKCFYSRHFDRTRQVNPIFKSYSRQCMCDYNVYKNSIVHQNHKSGRCPNEFETSYVPDRPEIVYCESCYNSEIA